MADAFVAHLHARPGQAPGTGWTYRFPDWAVGYHEWRGNPGDLQAIRQVVPPTRRPVRVFVSHSSRDPLFAERAAWLCYQEGLDSWVDSFDPWLPRVFSIPGAAVAVAAIVEMAILNCTHLLAMYTNHAMQSRWVGYEYGRLRDPAAHLLANTSTAWIPTNAADAPRNALPEYLLLGIQHSTEGLLGGPNTGGEIRHWLQQIRPIPHSVPTWPYTPNPNMAPPLPP